MQKPMIFFGLIFLFSGICFGQVRADFSGIWSYDKIISLPDEKFQTATIKMTVTQTPTEIKIERGAEGTFTFPINSEKTLKNVNSGGKFPVKLKSELTKKGKLNLKSEQVISINNENIKVEIEETFELSSDGMTIEINREIRNSKGLPSVEAFIAAKQQENTLANKPQKAIQDFSAMKISTTGGALNIRAKHLENPSVPNLGRSGGIIPVRVIFDETGKVIYSQTFFGHPAFKTLLVKAALKSIFEPVELNGNPVKVGGYITYNL